MVSEGEHLLIRMLDGPAEGTRLVPPMVLRRLGIGWPLPERLTFGDGYYEKVGQSSLEEPVPGVIRGAEYEWRGS